MNRRMHKIIACFIVASTLLVSSSFAGEINETLKNVPVKTASAFTETQISKEAGKVMLDVANARGDIHNKNTERAKKTLKQAIADIGVIDSLRPTDKIIDHIKVAKKHLEYESTQEVRQDLVLIAYDINQLKFLAPMGDVHKHFQNLKKAVASGDKKTAKKELITLQQTVSITGLYLPVNETKSYIQQALKELDSNHLRKADAILKKAENNLVVISVAGVRPIAKAKKTFYKAMVDYAHGKYAESKEDLHNSVLWLDKAMHSSDTTTRDEAKKLKEKAVALSSNLSKNTTDAKAKLNALWAQSKALSQRDLNSISSKYNNSKKKLELKTNLLDAKLYIEYAEIKQFIYGTKQGTKEELQKAKTSLQKASQLADTKTAQSIKTVESGIDNLEKDTYKTGAGIKEKYEKSKTDIDKIIRNL